MAFKDKPFILNDCSDIINKIGKTNKVKNVAINKPPMTTVAKGLWTSAPAPLLNAIGKKPNEATNAVINTGLSLSLVAFITISVNAPVWVSF